jgi:hypothetical protein
MSGKKRSKKGTESLEKQIQIHKEKLKHAQEKGDLGLTNYYEKEIEHFERAKEKLMRRIMPKLKRKK